MTYKPRKPGRFIRESEQAKPRPATKQEAEIARGRIVEPPASADVAADQTADQKSTKKKGS